MNNSDNKDYQFFNLNIIPENVFYFNEYNQLNLKDWRRFENEILSKYNLDDIDFRVHGTYYNDKSTIALMLQLASFIAFEEPLSRDNESVYLPRLIDLAVSDKLENISINYGSVLTKPNHFKDKVDYSIFSRQFTDDKSKIYKL